jgi:erythromycin esterase-like protein
MVAIRDSKKDLIDAIRLSALPLRDVEEDLEPVIERAAKSPIVLLGESTHGTREFYLARSAISRALIEHHGFAAIAVEADWPDAYRVNRFVRGRGPDASAEEALGDFKRFPRWMWRNTEVVALVDWLRGWNGARSPRERAGFYGLDLYSLHSSIDAVISYLTEVDPEAALRARHRYSCFDHAGNDDPQRYGHAATLGLRPPCEREAVEQLIELRQRAIEYLQRDGLVAEDEQFQAEMNARVVRSAEEYYRGMFGRRVNTWNLRDRHMAETLNALASHLSGTGRSPRIVVWAHNSHIGDARATEMGMRGELNLGQLARETWGERAMLVGLTTSAGTVSAASNWGDAVQRKHVRPPLRGSVEEILHATGLSAFAIDLRQPPLCDALREARLERAIGVIYRPETERLSHYFEARVAEQFDMLIHFDHTEALRPLEITPQWEAGEREHIAETFPTGL